MDGETRGQSARIGFVLFVATIIVIGGVYVVGGGIFTRYTHYKLLFPSTSGLHDGARVYLSGVGAGNVENVEFTQEGHQTKILVTVSIYKKYADRVRGDSLAWIQSEGLLGDKAVCILAGADTKPVLEENAFIPTVDRVIIEDLVGKGLINNANDLLENVGVLVKEINEGKSLVGRLLKDPDTGDKFSKVMVQLEQASIRLNNILDKIDKGEGSAGILVNDPTMAVSLKDLFLGVQESKFLTNLIRRAEETGRKLRVDDERAQEQMKRETDRVLEGVKGKN